MSIFRAIRGGGLKTRLLHPVDEWWDRRFGVHTVGFLPEVGDPNAPNWRAGYVPARYQRIVKALRHVGVGPDDTVVDLGCGLGRAVFAASWLGAKRSVGVEIDPTLVRQAQEDHKGSRLRERDIQFVCTPAEGYDLSDMTVLFMFNPFGTGTMQSVVRNLEDALRKRPRRLRIAYENPLQSAVLDASPLLKRAGGWPPQRLASPHPIAFWESVAA
jgi:SAM-dependent methyltransferase